MSKKWQREEKEIDRLYKENRELKSQVRSLEKILKKANRGFRKLEEDDKIEESDIPKEIVKVCWDCKTGVLEKKIIFNRYYRECSQCLKRTKAKLIS